MAWLTTPSIWYRRKPKIIRGSTAGAQIDYQLKLTIYKGVGTDTDNTIYLGGHVNNDFSDLRFTSSDETTLLPYWIESYTSGVSAVVWIKIDSIPVDPLTKTIYIYYDNLVASPGSNGINTFLLFDDFTTNTSTNYSIFNIGSGNPGSITWNSGGFLQIGSLNTTWHKVLYNKSSFDKNIAVDTKLRFDAFGADINNNGRDASIISRTALNGVYPDSGSNGGFDSRPVTTQQIRIKWGIDGTLVTATQAYSTGVWYNLSLTTYETEIKFYIDNTLKLSTTYGTVPATGYIGLITYEANTSIDDLRVRKFVSPEPVFSTTSPEQIYTANLTVSSTPTGAEIWINNIDQGVTTTSWFVLNPGTYTVMLTKPGYEDYIQIITLSSNQNAIVQGNLVLVTCSPCTPNLIVLLSEQLLDSPPGYLDLTILSIYVNNIINNFNNSTDKT